MGQPATAAPIDTWFASARRKGAALPPAKPKEFHGSPPSSEMFFHCQPGQPGSAPAHPILANGRGRAKDFLPSVTDGRSARATGLPSVSVERRLVEGV